MGKCKKAFEACQKEIADPWERLAAGIVIQAINDARAFKDGYVPQIQIGANISEFEVTQFFKSRWCGLLLGTTDIQPKQIMEELGLC